MRSNSPLHRSGDGTRPTTDGGVDNIGAGEKFAPGHGDDAAPAPRERMADAKLSPEATRHDESAAFGLTEDLKPETSRDPTQSSDRSGS
ncbi:hypothetical protein [Variovorax sp. LT1R16]|uniref:hypothetical protein n=1 Tax=Variovorax sp. LT1R16 TaxID=3443728 RepID=UPI003F446B5D